ncbi:hypothetical protein ACVW0Y_002293 [Pseudomonas sp. TE3786]
MDHPYPRRLFHSMRPVILVLTSLLIGIPAAAQAYTICEKGRITQLQLSSGGDSIVLVSTDNSPAANWQRHLLSTGKYATLMKQSGSPKALFHNLRWKDRLAQLRTAYALQQPIIVRSNDGDCRGPTDEFMVILCPQDGSACEAP